MSDSAGMVRELPAYTKARFDALAGRLAKRLLSLQAPATATEQQLSDATRVLARIDDVIDCAINAGRRESE